jgi:Domain of unknown function (DUF4157)/A nuclease family of the HNH/ENDO VII superfamily with conserved AHH
MTGRRLEKKPELVAQRQRETTPSKTSSVAQKAGRLPRTLEVKTVSPAQLEVQQAQHLEVQRARDLEVAAKAVQRAQLERSTQARVTQTKLKAASTRSLGVQRAVSEHVQSARAASAARADFVTQRSTANLERMVAGRLEDTMRPPLEPAARQSDLTLSHVADHTEKTAVAQITGNPDALRNLQGFKNAGATLVRHFRAPGSKHTMPQLAGAIQRFRDPWQRATVEASAYAAFGQHPTFPQQLQRALDEQDAKLEVQREAWRAELEPVAQRMAEQEASGENAASLIEAARGGGQPLPENVRAMLETKWNTDLSRVKIHTDSSADVISKKLNAKALTSGHDIFFRAGGWNPTSLEGLRLVAHETWHTLQQANGLVAAGVDKSASLETEARSKGAELSSADLHIASSGTPRGNPAVKTTSPRAPQTANAVQRDPAKPAAKPQASTPDGFVQGFREAVTKEALARLKTNSDKLNKDLKGLQNTDPSNPEWQRLRAISAQDAKLLERWKITAVQIRKLLLNGGSSDLTLLDMIVSPTLIRLGKMRGNIISSMRLALQTKLAYTRPMVQTAYTMKIDAEKIEAQLKPLEGLLNRAGLIEDIQSAIRIAYPALGVLDAPGNAGGTASAKNTKADNERMKGRVNAGFAGIQGNIKDLEAQLSEKDKAGKPKNVPVLELSAVVSAVLSQQGITEAKRKAHDPKASAVLDWLERERFWDTTIQVGGGLLAGGAAIAALFTPVGWATIAALSVGAAAGVGSGLYALQGATTESRAAQSGRGGTALTNTSAEEAQFNKVMSFINIGLAVVDGVQVLGAAGKLVRAEGLMNAAARSGSALLAKAHPAQIAEYLEAMRLRGVGKVKEAQEKLRLLHAQLGDGFKEFAHQMSAVVNPDGSINVGRVGGSAAGETSSAARVAGATPELHKLIPDDALLRELLQRAGSAAKLESLLKNAGNNVKQVERLLKAKNWREVEPFLHGQAGDLPKGYHYREIKNAADEVTQVQIVRRIGDDLEMAPLQIGADGTLKVTSQVSNRISNPLAMAKNFAAAFGKVKSGYWIHHLIPDEVVRNHPLMKLAREKLGYSLDRSSNLLGMADKVEWAAIEAGRGQKVGDGYTQAMGHWSSHTQYSKAIGERLDRIQIKLQERFGPLNKIPESQLPSFREELDTLLKRIEDEFRSKINKGQVNAKDGRLAWTPSNAPRTA